MIKEAPLRRLLTIVSRKLNKEIHMLFFRDIYDLNETNGFYNTLLTILVSPISEFSVMTSFIEQNHSQTGRKHVRFEM